MSELNLKDIIQPGQVITRQTLAELKELWVKTYLAFMMITSKGENKMLEAMRDKLAETNEVVMTFIEEQEKEG